MITHYEAIMGMLSGALGILGGVVHGLWRLRGWIAQTERLADAINNLAKVHEQQHADNQDRFRAIEGRLGRR